MAMPRICRSLLVMSATLLATFAASASAGATTLGNTTPPAGSSPFDCTGVPETEDLFQTATDSSYDYVVPAGGGTITSWSFNTVGAAPGTPYGLVVASPSFTVIGSDVETVPTSAPSIQTYTLSTPIQVQAGDLIGNVIEPTANATCYWHLGAVTPSDTVELTSGSPTAGTVLTPVITAAGFVTNISVNLATSEDISLTQQALPTKITAGSDSALMLNIASAGQDQAPVTVTDAVPAGLKIQGVSAGAGTCTVSGQNISCTVSGTPASIAVIVSAAKTGSYTNTAKASSVATDPNPSNNSSSVTLTVAASGASSCHVVSLRKVALAQAKTVIRALGCRVGKVTAKRSESIPKGEVISTKPGHGKKPPGTKVAIVYSSGKPK